jgi:hypothetical protein
MKNLIGIKIRKPVLNIIFFLLISSPAWADNFKIIQGAEQSCRNTGLSPGTKIFADCVLELVNRELRPSQRSEVRTTSSLIQRGTTPQIAAGSGLTMTPNGQACAAYGFKPKTTAFAQCQLELDSAQRQAEAQQRQYELQVQQHEQQVAAYNAQVAAAQRERERRQWEALARFGFGLATSRSPSLLGGVNDGFATALGIPTAPPAPPPRPAAIENYTIQTPSGRTVMCSYSTATSSMRCY